MSKFTPGPWVVMTDDGYGTYFLDNFSYKDKELYEINKTNAKLISKAPEMYELLDKVRKHTIADGAGNWFNFTTEINKLLNEIDS